MNKRKSRRERVRYEKRDKEKECILMRKPTILIFREIIYIHT